MTASTLTFAPAGTWRLDSTHSSVDFHVPYLAGTFRGRFADVDGRLEVGADGAKLTGGARVASVDVKVLLSINAVGLLLLGLMPQHLMDICAYAISHSLQ